MMSLIQRILFFLALPFIAVLVYPPDLLQGSGGLLAVVGALFLLIGFFLWRGNHHALTFLIFVQGMNAIVRLMLFFSHAVPKAESLDLTFAVTCLLGMALSIYLLLRLDKSDVRATLRN